MHAPAVVMPGTMQMLTVDQGILYGTHISPVTQLPAAIATWSSTCTHSSHRKRLLIAAVMFASASSQLPPRSNTLKVSSSPGLWPAKGVHPNRLPPAMRGAMVRLQPRACNNETHLFYWLCMKAPARSAWGLHALQVRRPWLLHIVIADAAPICPEMT